MRVKIIEAIVVVGFFFFFNEVPQRGNKMNCLYEEN